MRTKLIHILSAIVALGCVGMWAVGQDAKTVGGVDKIADDVQKKEWKELSKDGEASSKILDIADLMTLMRFRNPGRPNSGVGVGAKPGEIKPDGIEFKIYKMAREEMPLADLKKERAALIRMAERTAAIASIAVHQPPSDRLKVQKDLNDWKKGMEELHKESLNLIKAIKSEKASDVRASARLLKGICSDCHAVYRD